jgi:hypothetical protein
MNGEKIKADSSKELNLPSKESIPQNEGRLDGADLFWEGVWYIGRKDVLYIEEQGLGC